MIDISKKYKTRGGNEVVIHTMNGKDKNYPIVGEVFDNKEWNLTSWTNDGVYNLESELNYMDLVEDNEEEVTIYFWRTSGGDLCAANEAPHFHNTIGVKIIKLKDGKIV